jgi:uncharacterized protein HemX
MEYKELVEAAVLIVFIAVGGLAMGWFKILKQTNELLREQNEELRNDNKEWSKKHAENEKAIANLQGQLDVLKDIPLQNIATSLESISETNKKILGKLNERNLK